MSRKRTPRDKEGDEDVNIEASSPTGDRSTADINTVMSLVLRMMDQQEKRDREERLRREEKEKEREEKEKEDKRRREEKDREDHEFRMKLLEFQQQQLADRQADRNTGIEEALKLREFQAKQQGKLMKAEEEERQRREEIKEKKERLKAIPFPSPMTHKSDLMEYLELYEETVQSKEIPKDQWSTLLRPLLNDRFRGVAMKIKPEERADYDRLKQQLQDNDEADIRHADVTFWTLPKSKHWSALEYVHKLTRLGLRFVEGDTREACVDSMVKGRFIHEMPKDTRQYVRERRPETALKAAMLADEHFAAKEWDFTNWDSSKKDDGSKKDGRYNYHRRAASPLRPIADAGAHQDKGKKVFLRDKGRGDQKSDKPPGDFNKKCHICGGHGHSNGDCPQKINRIADHPSAAHKLSLREGKVFGKPLSNILLDTGAEVSLVSRDVLPDDYKKNGSITVQKCGTQAMKFPVALVEVQLGEHNFTVRCGIVEPDFINLPLLLGHNLPGIHLEDLLAETRPKQEGEHLGKATQKVTITDTQTPSPKFTQQPSFQKETEEPAHDVNRVQLVNAVQTRAMAKQQQQTQEDDDQATAQSQAIIKSWEDISPLAQDSLSSEPPIPMDTVTPQLPEDRKQFARTQRNDESLQDLFEETKESPSQFTIRKKLLYKYHVDPVGEPRLLLVVPTSLRRRVFEEAHSSTLAGHFAAKKTRNKIGRFFYWPGVARDTQTWCKQCDICQKQNTAKTHRSPLVPLPVIDQPWKRIAVDIVGPLPRSKSGFKYLLTCMDYASRYPEAIPLKRVDAKTVVDALIQIFSRFGVPDELLSDNGSAFTAKLT